MCLLVFVVSFTLNTTIIKIPSHDDEELCAVLCWVPFGSFDVVRYSLFAACNKSLISLIILLICWLVLSNSFSWRFKFSRNSGESSKQSANSRAANPDPPLITMALLSLTHQVLVPTTTRKLIYGSNPSYLRLSYSFARLNICFLSIESFPKLIGICSLRFHCLGRINLFTIVYRE